MVYNHRAESCLQMVGVDRGGKEDKRIAQSPSVYNGSNCRAKARDCSSPPECRLV